MLRSGWRGLSTRAGGLVSLPGRWPASATLSALVSLVAAVVLAAGVLAVPAGAAPTNSSSAQVLPTPTTSVTGTPTPPAPQSTAVPGGTGAIRGSLVIGIESPEAGQKLHSDRDFLIVGYGLDTSATVLQGAQGSGIDRVQIWLDIPPDATQLDDPELGLSDARAATFGSRFVNSGFRLMLHPGVTLLGNYPSAAHFERR